MKRTRIVFIAGGALLSAATAFSSNPLPEDTMYAVRRMLRVAQKPFQDNLTLDYEVIELDYSLPEVFFGMIRLKGDWPVERRPTLRSWRTRTSPTRLTMTGTCHLRQQPNVYQ